MSITFTWKNFPSWPTKSSGMNVYPVMVFLLSGICTTYKNSLCAIWLDIANKKDDINFTYQDITFTSLHSGFCFPLVFHRQTQKYYCLCFGWFSFVTSASNEKLLTALLSLLYRAVPSEHTIVALGALFSLQLAVSTTWEPFVFSRAHAQVSFVKIERSFSPGKVKPCLESRIDATKVSLWVMFLISGGLHS